ncbi:restriction endonuclease subunit S [Bacillus sp. FJAT-27231]|uniref:restriction endonuclease subunit S n=1 Tax=Bacillus sp. FJAT-27231 TaxID=1679168 RepID=UPI000670B6A8|nr:restriction endonuclease subunit S [Bacillus sp. FJAT-27231]KMY54937.1 restriction endonuclease subunit S [Bacillus sp. FJAT-27231]
MSKKKKTIEVLMEEVVVPHEEQPYAVPENWMWINSGHILNFIGGGTPSKSNSDYWNGDIPWATVKDIKNRYLSSTIDYITVEGLENSSATMASPYELLLITRMSPGKSTITKISTAINQDLKIVRPKIEILPYFLWLFFTVNTPLIESMSTGSTVKGIQVEKLKKIPFPVPPVNEQKRIARKVEHLLSKIEDAKQLIEEAKETFELRRAAFVNTLFEESSIKQMVNISDITDVKGGKRLPKGEALVNEDTGFPYIKAGDLKNGTVLMDKLQFLLPSTQEKIKSYTVSAGDVYITIVGACIGDVGVIPKEVDGANLTENAAKLTNLKDCLPEYLALCLSSNKAQNLIKKSIASATLGKLSLTRIKSLSIPLFDIETQKVIVKKYYNFIEKENKAAQNLDKVDLDMLKQSILSKAFRGELGTNNPSEESAIELLKEVL